MQALLSQKAKKLPVKKLVLAYYTVYTDDSFSSHDYGVNYRHTHDTRVSVLGVESIRGDCRFILADWGS